MEVAVREKKIKNVEAVVIAHPHHSFHFDADPDPDLPHQSDANLQQLVYMYRPSF
jgi:hypothetical protein